MSRGRGSAQDATQWSMLALAAVQAGKLREAAGHFERAIEAAPRDPGPRYNQALVLERLGAFDDAARRLTESLARRSAPEQAARRLASLAARAWIPGSIDIDAAGLLAAFGAAGIDPQGLSTLALRRLEASGAWGAAIDRIVAGEDAQELAASLMERRTAAILRDPLLLAALGHGIVTHPYSERLLTALRDLLLALPEERFLDPALMTFALALIHQTALNEGVWPRSREVEHALASECARLAGRLGEAGKEPSAGPATGLATTITRVALFLTPGELIDLGVTSHLARRLRPRALAETLAPLLDEVEIERADDPEIPSLTTVRQSTSQRVAGQYRARPYPRWRGIDTGVEGAVHQALARFFPPERLARLASPYEVLVAGCGTGRHACQSAIGHGSGARVLAIDLSRPSLAYARRQAAGLGISSIRFAEADILELPDELGPFHVIESVGVLHHLADPEAGGHRLASLLAPGGMMWLGLYSAISRRNIARYRAEPGYPGPDASDVEARAYRQLLLSRPPDEGEADIATSIDAHSLSGFRDLVLHQSEATFTTARIAAFLAAEGLQFRGFILPAGVWEDFRAAHPNEEWPGSLESWGIYEEANPRTFDAMYSFWCDRPDTVGR